MTELPRHIFRQYDVRGVVGVDLHPRTAYAVGRAFGELLIEGTEVSRPSVVVGRDNRPSSDPLAHALMEGVRASGCDAVNLGTVPTPVMYWAEHVYGAQAGLQVTGSHNPPEWNGIKMTVGGHALYGGRIQDVRERADRYVDHAFEPSPPPERPGVLDDYVRDLAGRIQLARPVKVAVDCGNGAGSLVAVQLLTAVGAEVVPLYCESDGTFPNHHPDPTVDENLADLIEVVRSSPEIEAGVAFDGDADRLGVVDEEGKVVRGDQLLTLFATDLLEREGPGEVIVFDVKCSQALSDEIEAADGVPVMWKTGHSLIKEKMRELGSRLAGELSGHICFGENYFGFDDALFGACKFVELLARGSNTVSDRVSRFRSYVSTPELRIHVPESEKFELIEEAVRHFRIDHEVIDVDGARILFDGGWGLVRASNTQPVIVARYEGRDQETTDRIRGTVEAWLTSRGVDVTRGEH